MDDLLPGMELNGTVRNVVDFGAFVDIGVKQDGLLHRTQIPTARCSKWAISSAFQLPKLRLNAGESPWPGRKPFITVGARSFRIRAQGSSRLIVSKTVVPGIVGIMVAQINAEFGGGFERHEHGDPASDHFPPVGSGHAHIGQLDDRAGLPVTFEPEGGLAIAIVLHGKEVAGLRLQRILPSQICPSGKGKD